MEGRGAGRIRGAGRSRLWFGLWLAPEASELSSALGTLRSRITGLNDGTATESSVTDAAKEVEADAVDLAIATRNACPTLSSS